MKISIAQLKQLIKEQVEEAASPETDAIAEKIAELKQEILRLEKEKRKLFAAQVSPETRKAAAAKGMNTRAETKKRNDESDARWAEEKRIEKQRIADGKLPARPSGYDVPAPLKKFYDYHTDPMSGYPYHTLKKDSYDVIIGADRVEKLFQQQRKKEGF